MKNKDKQFYSANKVRNSLAHFLMGRGVVSVASFLVAILLVRELSVFDYAAYTAISGMLIVLMMLSGGGLERVVPRYIPVLCQHASIKGLKAFCWKLIWLRIIFLLPVLLLIASFYSVVSGWFNLPADKGFVAGLLLYILAYGISMHITRILQALLLQKQATKGMLIEWFTKLFILLLYIYYLNELELKDVLYVMAFTIYLSIIYMLFVLYTYFNQYKYTGNELTLNIRQVINMGWHNYLQAITGMHTGAAVSKMLSAYFFPGTVTAAFGFAHAIAGTLKRYLPANLLLGLIEPVIMARYSENKDFSRTVHLVSIVLKVNLFILTPLTMWFYFSGEPLVIMITDGKYTDSVWMISALMVILMIESHYLVLQMIVNAIEKSQWLFYSNLWTMLLIPFVLVSIYTWHIAGLILGTLLLSSGKNIYVVWRLNKYGFKYVPDYFSITKLTLVSFVCVYISSIIFSDILNGLINLVVTGVVSAAGYLLFGYYWKFFTDAERETLNRFIGRRVFVW